MEGPMTGWAVLLPKSLTCLANQPANHQAASGQRTRPPDTCLRSITRSTSIAVMSVVSQSVALTAACTSHNLSTPVPATLHSLSIQGAATAVPVAMTMTTTTTLSRPGPPWPAAVPDRTVTPWHITLSRPAAAVHARFQGISLHRPLRSSMHEDINPSFPSPSDSIEGRKDGNMSVWLSSRKKKKPTEKKSIQSRRDLINWTRLAWAGAAAAPNHSFSGIDERVKIAV